MHNRIGELAGSIWKELNKKGEMTPRKMTTALKAKAQDVHLALGWLAREQKVEFNPTKTSFKVKLAHKGDK